MSKILSRRERIKFRVRKKIEGTSQRPRLSIFRSNKALYAQLIDDDAHKVLLGLSTNSKEFTKKGTKIEQAQELGKLFAQKATQNNIETCVFDRNGYLYHGRIKAFAEGARELGLKF